MAWTVTGNIKGPQGATGATGDTGATGAAGEGIEIAGQVATYGDLPAGLGTGDVGTGYLVEADGDLYIWSGTAFPADGSGVEFQGPQGIQGIQGIDGPQGIQGTTGAKGDTGNTGSTGADGDAATITVDSTTTGAAGTSAAVTNVGTTAAAAFKFDIPRGAAGADGTNGNDGADGSDGTVWFDGTGAPGTISGSKAGDYYMDNTSGDVYKLS